MDSRRRAIMASALNDIWHLDNRTIRIASESTNKPNIAVIYKQLSSNWRYNWSAVSCQVLSKNSFTMSSNGNGSGVGIPIKVIANTKYKLTYLAYNHGTSTSETRIGINSIEADGTIHNVGEFNRYSVPAGTTVSFTQVFTATQDYIGIVFRLNLYMTYSDLTLEVYND